MNACDGCLRRALLVADLAGHLDHLHAERGMLDEVFALDDGALVAALVPGKAARQAMVQRSRGRDLRPARELTAHARLAMLCRHDPGYPPQLRALDGPPPVLWVAGAPRLAGLLAEPAAAIVGARRASSYGIEVAHTLGRGLAAAGATVVSGMALGIDSAAHAGALESTGATIAVMAGGADVAYPRSKRALHGEIAARGAVVSEMPPGFRPHKWAFPARNRVIAALASLTVVVEAAERSGALITARAARELGREVAAVPGRVTAPGASGPNALVRDGAHLVDGPQAALDLLFGVGLRRAEPPRDGAELAPRLRAVLDAIREGRDTVGALAGPEQDPRGVLAALGELELSGYVRRAPGGAYVPLS